MINNKYFRGSILFIAIASSIYFGYKSLKKTAILRPEYVSASGPSINSFRDSLNIPKIEERWITDFYDTTHVIWSKYPKGVTSTEPMHLVKVIRFANKLPIKEVDEFHYETNSDTIAYRLVCTYSLIDNSTEFRFIKYFRSGNRFPPTEGYPVSHSFADSIFQEWGFHNYFDDKPSIEIKSEISFK